MDGVFPFLAHSFLFTFISDEKWWKSVFSILHIESSRPTRFTSLRSMGVEGQFYIQINAATRVMRSFLSTIELHAGMNSSTP